MTQFKEGDEVLVRAKFCRNDEDHYFDSSNGRAVLTFDHAIDGHYAPRVKDLIPVSALDVNKWLLDAAKLAKRNAETLNERWETTGPEQLRFATRSIARSLGAAIAAAEKGAIKQPPLSKSAKETRKPPSPAALLDAATEHDVPAKSARTVPILRAKGA